MRDESVEERKDDEKSIKKDDGLLPLPSLPLLPTPPGITKVVNDLFTQYCSCYTVSFDL